MDHSHGIPSIEKLTHLINRAGLSGDARWQIVRNEKYDVVHLASPQGITYDVSSRPNPEVHFGILDPGSQFGVFDLVRCEDDTVC